jgi:hypothetical protein
MGKDVCMAFLHVCAVVLWYMSSGANEMKNKLGGQIWARDYGRVAVGRMPGFPHRWCEGQTGELKA